MLFRALIESLGYQWWHKPWPQDIQMSKNLLCIILYFLQFLMDQINARHKNADMWADLPYIASKQRSHFQRTRNVLNKQELATQARF